MRLRRLELLNFGMYRGRQEIDLLPRTRGNRTRPIVLVGGQNGAGKTTILDAVRLCLYGKLALGARVTDAEYNRYLRERFHRNPDMLIPVTYASVKLEFDYAHAGVRKTYEVQRTWETKGETGVTELMRVQRDGQNLEDVESAIWPEFIRSLIPLGVSQLFFFDGEKIKRLAEEDTQSTELADSIKALLGLDVVERLQDDLDIYVSRFVKKTATGSRATRLAEIDASIRSLTEDQNRVRGERETFEVRQNAIADEIAAVEEMLAQRGEGLSAQRTTLTRRRAELSGARDSAQKELRALCEGALPMALCLKTTTSLRMQLTSEARFETWSAARDSLAVQ
jgi:DNA sulfur modification protein DndD